MKQFSIARNDGYKMYAMLNREKLPLANLTIRNLDPAIKERLRLRAARYGHSMEQEARCILREACQTEPASETAYTRLRRHFIDLGGIELELPRRQPGRQPPGFD